MSTFNFGLQHFYTNGDEKDLLNNKYDKFK